MAKISDVYGGLYASQFECKLQPAERGTATS